MNNVIILRTNKGEYNLDSILYGAVYLKISQPTEANGLCISLRGEEKCTFEYEHNGKKTQMKGESTLVDFSDLTLYSQKEYFEIGKYVFPFRFEIPKDIPGSFQYSGETDNSSWTASVSYHLKAYAIGAEDTKVEQQVIINETEEEQLKQRLFTEATCHSFDVMGFLTRKTVHVTAKLLDKYVRCGSNLQMKLIITNPSKFHVSGFRVKLIRHFALQLKDSHFTASIEPLHNMKVVDDVLHITPEGGPTSTHMASGTLGGFMIGNGGLDRLQLPLTQSSTHGVVDVPPSVSGKHVKNCYEVEVAVTFSNNHTETFALNIPGVLPRHNTEWSKWKPPKWTFHCDKKLSYCIFSVTEQMYRTEAFSGLPSFQVL